MVQSISTYPPVAVSGYVGAGLLLQDKNFVLATSSILANEARHQSALNVLNGGSYSPQPFDFAMRPEQVLSVVSPYITGCDLGLTGTLVSTLLGQFSLTCTLALKPLKVTSELQPGALIKFDTSRLPHDGSVSRMRTIY
jgi:hypothetical protein